MKNMDEIFIKIEGGTTKEIAVKALEAAGYHVADDFRSTLNSSPKEYVTGNRDGCIGAGDRWVDISDGYYEQRWVWFNQIVTKDYFTQPTMSEQKFCTGCNLGNCKGCPGAGYSDATKETVYAPLPLQPCNQWLRDRMKQIVEHISHALEQGSAASDETLSELVDLNHLLKCYEENR
jgi:hypothetical protein